MKSREEALDWAKRVPDPFGEGEEAVVEVRQFFELEEFLPSEALDEAREFAKKLEDKRKKIA